jgi:hypothetical protein
MKRSRPSWSSASTSSSIKSSSSADSCFDMSSFEQVSDDVADSLWFPTIAWPSSSDDHDHDDDSNTNDKDDESSDHLLSVDTMHSLSRKRVCRGLLRSSSSADLPSLICDRHGA